MAEFTVPLRLVTPHMKDSGDDHRVRDAQWLLSGHNRFKNLAPYKDGPLDGDYGMLTAKATERAKYWLGYPEASIDQVFGQRLYEYLRKNEWRPLPEEYRKRREQRLKAQTPGLKAMTFLRQYEGYHESPAGSNRTIFGEDYRWNGVAWCAIFETYGFKHTGWTRFRFASVELIYLTARAMQNGMRVVSTPQPGDLTILRHGDDDYAHTSFFVRWSKKGVSFRDFGGNTGPTDMSNGGMVLEQTRQMSQVKAFVRVG
jgi:hypothetical protein